MQERLEYQDRVEVSSRYCEPLLVTIDEKWIANECCLKMELITCPICYSIPLDYQKQCQKCERIFCQDDFDTIVDRQNRCPNCKAQPWVVKKDIHLTYKHMYDALLFNCNTCKKSNNSSKSMNKNQLIVHLQIQHNMYLYDSSILYDYILVNEKGQEVRLNSIQNIEMNYKRNLKLQKFEIGGLCGKILNIDLKETVADHPQFGKCSIHREKSKLLKKNYQYYVWIVNISEPDQHEGRMVFYSQNLQQTIQANYQNFLKNQRLNEFCLDVRDTRYRISFGNKSQTNTYTLVERRINRLPVIFR